jgi:myosin heavy subunit
LEPEAAATSPGRLEASPARRQEEVVEEEAEKTAASTEGPVDVVMGEASTQPPPSDPVRVEVAPEAATGEVEAAPNTVEQQEEPLVQGRTEARAEGVPDPQETPIVEEGEASPHESPLVQQSPQRQLQVAPSPQREVGGPSTRPEASGLGGDAWDVVLRRPRPSAARRSSVFSIARDAMGVLEKHLAEEARANAEERAELDRAWDLLHEAVEQGRRAGEAARAQREEAARFAQETRESVVREAEETLEKLREDREAVEAARESLELEKASKHQELHDLEKKIISDSEVVKNSLEKLRQDLAAREELLAQRNEDVALREADLVKREEQVEQVEKEQAARLETLEARESSVARDEAKYQERLLKANEQFAKKEKELTARLEEENATKAQLYRDNTAKEYKKKFKTQEERFTKRRKELEARVKELEELNQRSAGRVQAAKDAKEAAEQELALLREDLHSLQEQVEPTVALVEQARHQAAAQKVLTKTRRRMFKSLVRRGRALLDRLEVDAPAVPSGGDDNAAAYLTFFGQLLSKLEEAMANVDELAEEESRKLLGVAVCRIFSNLAQSEPTFDFKAVTTPVAQEHFSALHAKVWPDVEAYIKRFKRVVAQEDEGEEDAEEGSDEGGEESDDDAPSS